MGEIPKSNMKIWNGMESIKGEWIGSMLADAVRFMMLPHTGIIYD